MPNFKDSIGGTNYTSLGLMYWDFRGIFLFFFFLVIEEGWDLRNREGEEGIRTQVFKIQNSETSTFTSGSKHI